MVSRHGFDNHELHQQGEGTEQREKELGCSRETVGSNGIPSDARERQVAIPNTKA